MGGATLQLVIPTWTAYQPRELTGRVLRVMHAADCGILHYLLTDSENYNQNEKDCQSQSWRSAKFDSNRPKKIRLETMHIN